MNRKIPLLKIPGRCTSYQSSSNGIQVFIYIYIYIYWQHFFINTYFIEHNIPFYQHIFL